MKFQQNYIIMATIIAIQVVVKAHYHVLLVVAMNSTDFRFTPTDNLKSDSVLEVGEAYNHQKDKPNNT